MTESALPSRSASIGLRGLCFLLAGTFADRERRAIEDSLDRVSREQRGSPAIIVYAALGDRASEAGARQTDVITVERSALEGSGWTAPIDKAVGGRDLDGVICRFEATLPRLLTDLGEEDWQSGLRVNATACWSLAQWAMPLLAKTRGSLIVFTARAAQEVLPGGGVFPAAKALEASIMRSIAAEAEPLGVRVNLLAPSPKPANEQLARDVAETIAFMIGETSRTISGQTLALGASLRSAATTRSLFEAASLPQAKARSHVRAERLRVIGGTGGIGLASIRSLASLAKREGRSGLDVLFVGRNVAELTKVQAELRGEGLNAHFFAGDLVDPAVPGRIVQTAVDLFGGIDVVHNNGALGIMDTALGAPRAEWERIVSINLSATWRFAKAAFPHLRQSGGSLIATSSIAALSANEMFPLYSATKAALNRLVVQLAHEWAREGVRANIISPGSIETKMNPVVGLSDGEQRNITETFPIPRMGNPSEIGEGVAFLASSGASYLTGHDLVIDGGLAQSLR